MCIKHKTYLHSLMTRRSKKAVWLFSIKEMMQFVQYEQIRRLWWAALVIHLKQVAYLVMFLMNLYHDYNL